MPETRRKLTGTIAQVPEGEEFVTHRNAIKPLDCDTLKFIKETQEGSNAYNLEFGRQTIHAEQLCWWYEEN
jgi:hypothetical protein